MRGNAAIGANERATLLYFVSAKILLFSVICKFRTKKILNLVIFEHFIGKIGQNHKKNAFL